MKPVQRVASALGAIAGAPLNLGVSAKNLVLGESSTKVVQVAAPADAEELTGSSSRSDHSPPADASEAAPSSPASRAVASMLGAAKHLGSSVKNLIVGADEAPEETAPEAAAPEAAALRVAPGGPATTMADDAMPPDEIAISSVADLSKPTLETIPSGKRLDLDMPDAALAACEDAADVEAAQSSPSAPNATPEHVSAGAETSGASVCPPASPSCNVASLSAQARATQPSVRMASARLQSESLNDLLLEVCHKLADQSVDFADADPSLIAAHWLCMAASCAVDGA